MALNMPREETRDDIHETMSIINQFLQLIQELKSNWNGPCQTCCWRHNDYIYQNVA